MTQAETLIESFCVAQNQPDIWPMVPPIGARQHQILITSHNSYQLYWECTCQDATKKVRFTDLEIAKYEWFLHLLKTLQKKEE